MLKLNLGCGLDYKDGYINIDCIDTVKKDLKVDLDSEFLPYKENEVDEVFFQHVLEHLKNPIDLLNDIHRVLKPDGLCHIIVPNVRKSDRVYSITHKTFWDESTFEALNTEYAEILYGIKQWIFINNPETNDRGDIHLKMRPKK